MIKKTLKLLQVGWTQKLRFNITAQYDANSSSASLGSVRPDKTYVIHPESIKQGLRTGEAYCVGKVGGFGWDKVKVIKSKFFCGEPGQGCLGLIIKLEI